MSDITGTQVLILASSCLMKSDILSNYEEIDKVKDAKGPRSTRFFMVTSFPIRWPLDPFDLADFLY